MALHDYRKLIDFLHTSLGDTFALTIEVVDPPTDSHEGPIIRVESLAGIGRGFEPVDLTEHDAGALFDALGGALRTIAAPPVVAAEDWDAVARDYIADNAKAILDGSPDAIEAAQTTTIRRLYNLNHPDTLALAEALLDYAAATLAAITTLTIEGGIVGEPEFEQVEA